MHLFSVIHPPNRPPQVFIEAKAGSKGSDLERELFIIRKLIEKEKAARMGDDAADFYVASLSDKTMVYKVGTRHIIARDVTVLAVPTFALTLCRIRRVEGKAPSNVRKPVDVLGVYQVPGAAAWNSRLQSSGVIVLQGMLTSSALGDYYKDLRDERFTTPFAIYHRRYSTNTTPKWPLAQPMRFLGHNGESHAGFQHQALGKPATPATERSSILHHVVLYDLSSSAVTAHLVAGAFACGR